MVRELVRLPDGTSWALVYAKNFNEYWYLFVGAAIAYLPVVVLLRSWMRDRKPFSLKPLLVVWNGALAALSVAMVIACEDFFFFFFFFFLSLSRRPLLH
jgi:hypothetical protein